MTSAPQNPIQRVRLGAVFVVRVGDENGNAPTESDEQREVNLITLERGTGGRKLDRAVFSVDIGRTGQRIVDFQVDPNMNRQVELYAIDENGDNVPMFWGEFDQQNLEIVNGEKVVITASVQKQHFGGPLAGPEEYNKVEDSNLVLDKDLVFNPEIEGTIYGNQRTDPNATAEYLFVDPLSNWTSTAEAYIGTTPELWTVETACETLCRLANESETFIKNPDTFTVVNLAPVLKNFTIKRGTYLHEALGQLLEPHGFSWYVNVFLDDGGTLQREIHLISQGTGIQKNVYFQRPGEVLDIKKSNAPEITVETSLSEMANKITVQGDFIKRESTLELKKGWAEAQDALTPDELQKKDESSSQFETYPNAHRKWVFNEGGDYNGLRTETGSAPADLTFFNAGEGEEYVHKRRKTERLLTFDKDGNRREQYLEFFDNSLSSWKPVPPEWGYDVLDDEIGIYFNGNKPPAELWEQGTVSMANMRLRMTCVVACDKRISYTATRQASSPNGRDIELYIDASDRFFDKQVLPSSPFFGAAYTADEVDSTTDIQTYAEELRDVNDSANLRAAIVLEGIVNSYKRGNLIAKVDGRNISLNRNSSDVATKKFLQVTSILFDAQKQRTVLETESFT